MSTHIEYYEDTYAGQGRLGITTFQQYIVYIVYADTYAGQGTRRDYVSTEHPMKLNSAFSPLSTISEFTSRFDSSYNDCLF